MCIALLYPSLCEGCRIADPSMLILGCVSPANCLCSKARASSSLNVNAGMSPSASESSTASSSAEGVLSLQAKVITKKVWMRGAACLDTTFPRMYSSHACCQFIGVLFVLTVKRLRLTLPCPCKASSRLVREKPMFARNGTLAVSATKLHGLKNKLQYLALS